MKTQMTDAQKNDLLALLKNRFEKNMTRHEGLEWNLVAQKLLDKPHTLATIFQMEETGGEPDVVILNNKADITFVDCAAESPKGRRSYCYDRAALDSRKEAKPANSAVDCAQEIGIELLNESQYRRLQEFGNFDLKTSSWLKTPDDIRKLKGAIFGDKRYDHVFIYHNGAESYYAARGFRGYITL